MFQAKFQDKQKFVFKFVYHNFMGSAAFLAHLSQRLIGELIEYPWSGVRRRRRPSVRPQFQTSSPLKPLGLSKPNFMWSLLG